MREWEQATWASGQTEKAVIHCAGTAVARAAEHWTRPAPASSCWRAKVTMATTPLSPPRPSVTASIETVRVTDPAATTAQLPAQLESGCALLLDGLFGIGLNRPLSAPWLHLIRLINGSGVPVLAVDVPVRSERRFRIAHGRRDPGGAHAHARDGQGRIDPPHRLALRSAGSTSQPTSGSRRVRFRLS
jgi:hypothetical protein